MCYRQHTLFGFFFVAVTTSNIVAYTLLLTNLVKRVRINMNGSNDIFIILLMILLMSNNSSDDFGGTDGTSNINDFIILLLLFRALNSNKCNDENCSGDCNKRCPRGFNSLT